MSTSRPFGYNTGSTINGTDQYGDLVVGVDNLPYNQNIGNVRWWNGPDEDLGYVIATTNVDNNGNPLQPTPNLNEFGSVRFFRTDGKDDNLFLNLSNTITNQNFTTPLEAKIWLEENGYWSSWVGDVPLGPLYTNLPEYIINDTRQATSSVTIRSNVTATRRFIVTETIVVEGIIMLRIPPSNWNSTSMGSLRPTFSVVGGSNGTIDGSTSSKQFYGQTIILNPPTNRTGSLEEYDTYIMKPTDNSLTTFTPGEYDLSIFSTSANISIATLLNSTFPIDTTKKIHPSPNATTTHFVIEIF